MLPVNVMACKQVLVIWGTTYPNRLWCIWELILMWERPGSIEFLVPRVLLVLWIVPPLRAMFDKVCIDQTKLRLTMPERIAQTAQTRVLQVNADRPM